MDFTYSTADQLSKELNEKNDCAVRAVSIACETDYRSVHTLMTAHGRRHRCGTNFETTTKAVISALDYDAVDITSRVRGKTVKTVARELHNGRFLVRVSRHILAVVDGKVEDWTDGRQHRVKQVLKVVKKPSLVAPPREPVLPRPAAPVAPAKPKAAPKAPAKPAAPVEAPKGAHHIPGPKPRPGSLKDQIHNYADQMWFAAKCPTDVRELQALRREVIAGLVEQDVKATSASAGFAQWKNRRGL